MEMDGAHAAGPETKLNPKDNDANAAPRREETDTDKVEKTEAVGLEKEKTPKDQEKSLETVEKPDASKRRGSKDENVITLDGDEE